MGGLRKQGGIVPLTRFDAASTRFLPRDHRYPRFSRRWCAAIRRWARDGRWTSSSSASTSGGSRGLVFAWCSRQTQGRGEFTACHAWALGAPTQRAFVEWRSSAPACVSPSRSAPRRIPAFAEASPSVRCRMSTAICPVLSATTRRLSGHATARSADGTTLTHAANAFTCLAIRSWRPCAPSSNGANVPAGGRSLRATLLGR